MSRVLKKAYWLLSGLIILIIIALALTPDIYINACFQGILIWATVVLPSIFPFLFFTKILTDLHIINIIAERFTIFTKLFRTPPISAYAFLTSILSGYPVGAKIVSDLYENGSINKEDAFKITTFTSNSGPMFILGSVGIGMLLSRKLGLIMLFSHIIGAVLNGLLYRNHKEKINSFNYVNKNIYKSSFQLAQTMWNSISSILIVGGYICIFFVLIEMLNYLNVFPIISLFFSSVTNLDNTVLLGILNGIVEMTHGCIDIAKLGLEQFWSTIICCGLITFGGIATMLQAITFLQKFQMRFGFFIKQKITHTFFSVLICTMFLLIF
ncbi:MAG: hypothetical protein PHX09_01525 [Clostridia bacterium]|nr:hypothetical protein [Clostridia bacterium]MDD4686091.1 hypothetical protein [Clostridia bacterium]